MKWCEHPTMVAVMYEAGLARTTGTQPYRAIEVFHKKFDLIPLWLAADFIRRESRAITNNHKKKMCTNIQTLVHSKCTKAPLLFFTKFRSQTASRYCSVHLQEVLYFFPLLSVVLIGDEEPDPASRAHLEEGGQRSSGICFLPPATLEEGRGSLKSTTLHLGGQYVSL